MTLPCILLGTVGALILLFWYQNAIWGPGKKRQMMQKGPLVELQNFGFRPTEQALVLELTGKQAELAVAFIGTVSGYATEVSFGWTDRPHILVRVFFDPGSRDYDAAMTTWEKLKAGGTFFGPGLFWAPVYADATIQYNFTPPNSARILSVAETIAAKVQELGKAPLDYVSGSQLSCQLIEESRRRSEKSKQNG